MRVISEMQATRGMGSALEQAGRRSLAAAWRRAGTLVGLMGLVALSSGCAAHKVAVNTVPTAEAPNPAPRQHVEGETAHISASPDPVVGSQTFGAEELFFEAQKRFDAEEFTQAAEIYQRIITDFPDSRYLAPALLMQGRALLELKQPREALAPFQRYLEAYPNGRQRYAAFWGLGDAHAALAEWPASEQDFQQLLAIPGLSASQRDNGRARLGRAQVEQGRLTETVDMLEEVAGRHPPFMRDRDEDSDNRETGAIARFYVGEVQRMKAEQVSLDGGASVDSIEAALEEKAQLTLAAHQHYYRTFSYSLPEYTAKAAYRMAWLYERFYNDVMAAPPPQEMSEEDAALYKEMLDEQLDTVVKKAYDLYGQVIRHADRFELKGEYVEMCKEGMTRLEARVQQRKNSAPPEGKHAKAPK